MTSDEHVARIEQLITSAFEYSFESGLVPTLKFEGLPQIVFEAYRSEIDGDVSFAKCACGNCGNLVVSFEMLVSEGDAAVVVLFVRSATEEETVRYLEEALG